MDQKHQYDMQCAEFEVLLAEAVEGLLDEGRMQNFRSHADTCAVCAAAFAEATTGYQWMRSLEPLDPPVHLVHNILAVTTGVEPASTPAQVRVSQTWPQRIQAWLRPVLTPMLRPRFGATFAMAFFSVTLMLNLAGVDLRQIDWRPNTWRGQAEHTFYSARTRVVRYYDSMRVVYEFQARAREVLGVFPEENNQQQQQQQPQQREEKKEKNNKDISVQPEPKPEEENQARQSSDAVLASYSLHPLRSPYFVMQRSRRTA